MNNALLVRNSDMTLREYYAGQALQGLTSQHQPNSDKYIAKLAVKFADALIVELDKTNEEASSTST